MKRFIAMAVLAVMLAAVVIAPCARATDYNPDQPPWAYLMQAGNEDSGDDNGFVEIDAVGPETDSRGWRLVQLPWTCGGSMILGIIVDLWEGNSGEGELVTPAGRAD